MSDALLVKPIVIKTAIRALGSLGALLGLSMLGIGVILLLPSNNTSPANSTSDLAITVAFSAFQMLLGLFLIYVGYRVWFRLSPQTVRYVLGMLGFFLFGAFGIPFEKYRSTISPEITGIAVLIEVIALCLLYRCAVAYCCRRLFPATLHNPAGSLNKPAC